MGSMGSMGETRSQAILMAGTALGKHIVNDLLKQVVDSTSDTVGAIIGNALSGEEKKLLWNTTLSSLEHNLKNLKLSGGGYDTGVKA